MSSALASAWPRIVIVKVDPKRQLARRDKRVRDVRVIREGLRLMARPTEIQVGRARSNSVRAERRGGSIWSRRIKAGLPSHKSRTLAPHRTRPKV